jgi:hypothetical protein
MTAISQVFVVAERAQAESSGTPLDGRGGLRHSGDPGLFEQACASDRLA